MVDDENSDTQSEDEPEETAGTPVDEHLWEDVKDMDRGIFTKQDRKYLTGQAGVDGQDERNTRYRIRQRVISSFLDIHYLMQRVDDEDMSQIANSEELTDSVIIHGSHEPRLLTDLVFLAYQLAVFNEDVLNPIQALEESVETAVRNMERRQDPSDDTHEMVKSTAEIEVYKDRPDVEEIKELYSNVTEEKVIEQIMPEFEYIDMDHEQLVEETKEYYRNNKK